MISEVEATATGQHGVERLQTPNESLVRSAPGTVATSDELRRCMTLLWQGPQWPGDTWLDLDRLDQAPGTIVALAGETDTVHSIGYTHYIDATVSRRGFTAELKEIMDESSSLTRHFKSTEMAQELAVFFRTIIDRTAGHVYEDGMESGLSYSIGQAIEKYGDAAIAALIEIVRAQSVEADTVGEILRQVGYSEDWRTHETRLEFACESLSSSDPRIRDASLLALAALSDSSVSGVVRAALSTETVSELQSDMLLLLEELDDN